MGIIMFLMDAYIDRSVDMTFSVLECERENDAAEGHSVHDCCTQQAQ